MTTHNAIIESSITCPITLVPMHNPVTGPDGQTYEKEAIVKWLNEKGTSPHDRRVMNVNELQVNSAIRYLCDKYHNGEFVSTETPRDKPTILNNSIKLNCDVYKRMTTNDNHVMMSFNVDESNDHLRSLPEDKRYLDQDIVIVIDRSYSMNTQVTSQDSDGKNIESGWSIQDVVNHAACTIIKSVNTNTRIAVIAFDNLIEEIVPLTLMTEINKATSIAKVKEIKPRGQTNLWGGIEKAISILDVRDDKSRNGNIMSLTDGTPNISPALGEVETLKKLRIKKNFTASIYTFGFGYHLKDGLLYELAKVANGGYGYISDGGMIATVMCNFISTILTTIVSNLQLHVTTKSQERVSPDFMLGDYETNISPNNETIFDIGTVQIQQSRDIIMNFNPKETYEMYYTYKIGGQPYTSNIITIDVSNCNGVAIPKNIIVDIHKNRYDVVHSIRKMINYNLVGQYDNSRTIQAQLENQFEEFSKVTNNNLIHGLLNNLKQIIGEKNSGQINMAVTNPNYFTKWGKHYLDQVCRSLNNQQKPNFKDKGMPFGGPTFENLIEQTSDTFNSLPPPESSLINMNRQYNTTVPYNGIPAQRIPQRPIVMANLNNARGGCFDSNCTITMADGSTKILKNLNKGDKILSCDLNNVKQIASIVCILEIKIKYGLYEFVDFENGLYITPWHPIKYNNEWVFPANIKTPVIKSCNSIITLVLDNHHIGFINGYQCIMLGHNYKNGILNHPYYGTDAIINTMKNHYGWESGKVVLNDTSISVIKKNEMTSYIKIDSCTRTTNVY
jgi:hypothetical protein